jgi:hypothetical protein
VILFLSTKTIRQNWNLDKIQGKNKITLARR